jgi:hypothetical protein
VGAELPRVDAEDLVTGRKLGDRRAGCFDVAGQFGAEDPPPRPEQTGEHPGDERLGLAHSAVGPVDRRGVDPDQDLVVLGYRPLDVLDPQDVRRPVPVADNRLHPHSLAQGARPANGCSPMISLAGDDLAGPRRTSLHEFGSRRHTFCPAGQLNGS